MRIATVVGKLLGVTGVVVEGVALDEMGMTVGLRPSARRPRCGQCGGRAPGYDRAPVRRWRHLGLGAVRIWLTYAPRRVSCPQCKGVRVEQVSWAAHDSCFTKPFEEMTAYLAQGTDKTKVTELMGIAWQTVGTIIERVVERGLDPARLENLRMIGVDEFSYRKRHRYVTLVVDHERRRVVWASKGRGAEVLNRFFEALGPEGRAKVTTVTLDLAAGFTKSVKESVPGASISYDRFHVQRLASDAVDEVRRKEVNEAGDGEQAAAIKNSRFALLRNDWNLTQKDEEKLSGIQRTNRRLYRAYLLKEALRAALDHMRPERAMGSLRKWLAWASRSRLAPFVRTARTIRKHLQGIAVYLLSRMTNGLTEGLNNKVRAMARRAYGFHSAEALIGMVFLTCGGIQLSPPLPGPTLV
jgi:transposase